MSKPLYSIGTWDMDAEGYTPQAGVSVPAFNITRSQLRRAMTELRGMGCTCHRFRDPDGGHDNNDTSVIIERTDGLPESEILEAWKR